MIYQIGDRQVVHPDGFAFDAFSFGLHDFEYLASRIVRDGLKTILEVGAGLSSLLLSQLCHVDTLENDPVWQSKINHAREDRNDMNMCHWDGKTWPDLAGPYDAVFIDGPVETDPTKRAMLLYAGQPREVSFAHAADLSDVIFVHDGSRFAEMTYQLSYLAPTYHVTDIVKSNDGDPIRYLVAWKRIAGDKK